MMVQFRKKIWTALLVIGGLVVALGAAPDSPANPNTDAEPEAMSHVYSPHDCDLLGFGFWGLSG